MHGGLSPANHIRNSPGASISYSPSTSSFGHYSPMAMVALSPARAPLYICGGSRSPAYPFPFVATTTAVAQCDGVTAMGPPPPSKVKKHKKKKHKKKKPGLCLYIFTGIPHASALHEMAVRPHPALPLQPNILNHSFLL